MTISGVEQAGRILRVLHVEDAELDHQLILAELGRAGLRVALERLDSLPLVLAALDQRWDAILSDYNLPGFSGLEVLEALQQRNSPETRMNGMGELRCCSASSTSRPEKPGRL